MIVFFIACQRSKNTTLSSQNLKTASAWQMKFEQMKHAISSGCHL
jgi:hypothetical protein